MNTKNNMLSAKNVRIHGMDDVRWTKQEKANQYKGLIKLFKRDRKIVAADTVVAARKQKMELRELKKDIESGRNHLQAMIKGDKQKLRNALAEHKDMQLAYQELPALQVIDHIYQNNFTKRKQLDLLKYRTEERTQILITLKLRKSILEDRLKYLNFDFPAERKAEIITGKVQDAILKKEAALVVREAYLNIINIMKKDALYYDAILEDLKNDALTQGRCMIRATQLGQLAIEYLDDRKMEFIELQEVVKRDMKHRVEDLALVSKEMELMQNNMRFLIRKDSDINCGKIILSQEFSNKDLAEQVQNVENILAQLQSVTMVSSFEAIYPCLVEQVKKKLRLAEFKQKSSKNHETMLNKIDHATTLKYIMENTVIETTNIYIDEKKRMKAEIEAQCERKGRIEKIMKSKNVLLANIKASLKQLEAMCEIINDGNVKIQYDKDRVMLPIGEPLFREKCPNPGEFDGKKLIESLMPKVQKLMASAAQHYKGFNEERKTSAIIAYSVLANTQMRIIDTKGAVHDESLIDEAGADISMVPTREEIKKISAAIVKQCNVDPDLVPAAKK